MTATVIERQIVLDTETTGLDPALGHRITEIGCLEIVNRKLTGRKFHSYLNPERELDRAAADISGLSLDFLKDKPKFLEVADDFLTFIADSELIIHNAPFDLGFINSELRKLLRQGLPLPIEQHCSVFDTLALARKLHPGQKNNLDALCKRYGIDNSHRTYHGALLDAEILSKVYLHMTAGQTRFALGEPDTATTTNKIKKMKPRRLVERSSTLSLMVIKASEEECALHETRLKELGSKF